jgi:hypothetical protein
MAQVMIFHPTFFIIGLKLALSGLRLEYERHEEHELYELP